MRIRHLLLVPILVEYFHRRRGAARFAARDALARHIPEKFLRAVLGVSNGVVGLLYVLGYFGLTRFKI